MARETKEERKHRILDFLVRDYIKTAEPVSSFRVREGLNLSESPATVRSIIAELDEEGFLEQPHVSAGRIPTDGAYRYFVDNLISEISYKEKLFLEMRRMFSREENELGRVFAQALNLLSFSGVDGEHFESYGLSYLLQEPEFSNSEAVRSAGYLLDNIDEVADLYIKNAEKEKKFFIGKENPVRHIHEFGVCFINSKRDGHKRTVLLVGPKRMDYEKISNWVNCFLEKF